MQRGMGMASEYDERLPADHIDVDISNIPHLFLERLSVITTRNRQEWNEAFKVDDANSPVLASSQPY